MRAWSYSALTAFESCPKRYFHLSIRKDVREKTTEALNWGSDVHKAIEKYMLKGTPLPLGMKQFAAILDPIKAAAEQATAHTELELALDEQFMPSPWFGDRTWVRAKVDYMLTHEDRAAIFDWKTGKRKDDPSQLALMAAIVFAQEERIRSIDSAFVWLGERPERSITRVTYTRDSLPEIWNDLLPRVEKFQEACRTDTFPAKPGFLCKRYCPVKQCPYHGE